MNNQITAIEYIDALNFAHAMGLASETEPCETVNTALDFACAMGLKKTPVREKKPSAVRKKVFIPRLRFC